MPCAGAESGHRAQDFLGTQEPSLYVLAALAGRYASAHFLSKGSCGGTRSLTVRVTTASPTHFGAQRRSLAVLVLRSPCSVPNLPYIQVHEHLDVCEPLPERPSFENPLSRGSCPAFGNMSACCSLKHSGVNCLGLLEHLRSTGRLLYAPGQCSESQRCRILTPLSRRSCGILLYFRRSEHCSKVIGNDSRAQ